MSVAFRRESDEKHREPRFELPIPPGPDYATQRGRVPIGERVADLEAALAAAGEQDRHAIARDMRAGAPEPKASWWTGRETRAAQPARAVPDAGRRCFGVLIF